MWCERRDRRRQRGRSSLSVVMRAAFPPTSEGVRAARHFVARHIASPSLIDDAALVVSELAANAVLHAASPFSVTISTVGGRLRIEVSDDSPTLPRMKDHGDAAPTGRGLKIVDRLTTRWGADRTSAGKTVWAEMENQSADLAQTHGGRE